MNLESPRSRVATPDTGAAKALVPLQTPPPVQPETPPVQPDVQPAQPAAQPATPEPKTEAPQPETVTPQQPAVASPEAAAAAPLPVTVPPIAAGAVSSADLDYLASRKLLIPVQGISANQLTDTFGAGRSEGRQHQALDIMAQKDTPVLATTDGTIVRLFQSDKGGITLYQADPSGSYIYYYAHLSRYAEGMTEGRPIRRGEIIGYVGDTGNAGAGNFHLHFSISKVDSPRKWSGGEPINPYPLFAGRR